MNLELIKRPFSSDQIKQRKTSLGYTVDYLETHTIIARLNEAFIGEWSFRVIEHQLLEDVVVVLGELAVEGVTKQQFGTCELSQESEEGIVFSIGDALKAAASDALKKSATLFGIGLQLYGSSTETSAVPDMPDMSIQEPVADLLVDDKSPEPKPEPEIEPVFEPEIESESITDLQLAEIVELAKDRNFTQAQVDQRARSRYGRGLAELTRPEADEIISKLKGN